LLLPSQQLAYDSASLTCAVCHLITTAQVFTPYFKIFLYTSFGVHKAELYLAPQVTAAGAAAQPAWDSNRCQNGMCCVPPQQAAKFVVPAFQNAFDHLIWSLDGKAMPGISGDGNQGCF
jgi:hypothetical protein